METAKKDRVSFDHYSAALSELGEEAFVMGREGWFAAWSEGWKTHRVAEVKRAAGVMDEIVLRAAQLLPMQS